MKFFNQTTDLFSTTTENKNLNSRTGTVLIAPQGKLLYGENLGGKINNKNIKKPA